MNYLPRSHGDEIDKIQKLSSFKSYENIHKREDGSYYVEFSGTQNVELKTNIIELYYYIIL